MPQVVPDHANYTLNTDDGQIIDMYHFWFSQDNIKACTMHYGSEAAACEALQGFWDQFCQNPRVMGLKPLPGSTSDDVQVHQLFPDYSVRIWGAGLEQYSAYYFDFVNPVTSHPINLPPTWRIFNAPGVLASVAIECLYPSGTEVTSMEACHGLSYREILPGEEKYMQPEGARLRVVSPCGREAFFQLPIRRSIHLDAGQVLVEPATG